MKDNIRTLTATALLMLGFTKASSTIEGAITLPAANPEPSSGFCVPCNYIE
jgi:hypothetical protein